MKKTLTATLKYLLQLRGMMLVFSLIIAACGYLFYQSQANAVRQEKYNDLKAIADLKVSQIENWLQDRDADAKVVAHSPFFIDGISRWLQDTANVQLKEDIIMRLQPVQMEMGYENLFLAKTNGGIMLKVKTGLEEFDRLTRLKIKEASAKKEIVFTDFYFCQKENKIHYDIIAPIVNKKDECIAVLIFRRDPNDFLYPLIQTWPTPSKSAETAILRVENDSVVFLNELRHRKNTALKFKIPLTRTELPAVQAAMGRTGLFEGIDYRGVKVLSDIRIIPGVNWILLSKVDMREIYAGLILTAGIITGFTILLIFACGIGLAFIYNSRQKTIYRELYRKEKELWGQQEKFKVTMDSLGEGILTLDINGKVQYMNKLAEEMTGWNLKEARGRELHDVYPVKNEETGQRENNILDKIHKHGIVKELANHTLLISKSGKEIPVMDTGAPVYDNEGSMIGIVIAFQDETDKRKQHKLLVESEDRYRNLVDNASVGVYESTADGKILFGNNAIIEMLGFKSPEEFLSAPAIMHHKNPERRVEMISHLKQHGKVENFENEVITKDGRNIHILVSAKLAGNVLSGMVVDVTGRKIAEEALRASDALLQSAINVLPVGLWILDAEGKIVISSAAAQRIWAGVHYIDVDQLGEYKGWRTDSGKLIEAHEWAGARALENGETSIEEEVEIECFDGTHKIILDTAVPLRKSDGSIGGAITINQDITERKQAEIKYKKSIDRFNRLVEELNDVVWTASIDGSELLDVNGSFESIYGISLEEYKNTPNLWIDRVHPDDRSIAEASGRELFEKGKTQAEYRIVRPDGRVVWLLDRKSLIYDEDGKAVQMGGIAKDITERKLAEEKVRMRTEDLTLINSLNFAINRGDKLDEIIKMLSNEIMRIFNCFGTIMCFPDPDKSFLLPINIQFPSPLTHNLEKLVGARLHKLPLKIALKGNGKIASIMRQGFPTVLNDASEIIEVMAEFTENDVLKQLAPAIFKLLHFRSMVLIPLISENEILGMLEIARDVQTSDEELDRLKVIAGQLTLAVGRKLADERVIDERNNAKKYFETAGTMLVILDNKGKVVRINKKGCEVLQYAESEIAGKDWFDFLPENNAQEVRTVFGQLMNGEIEILEFYENPVETQKGEERLIAWHNVMLRDTNGKPVGIISSGEDITERKKSEELIREKEEHFLRTLELGVVGIATTHPITYYFLSANQRLCEMVGYTEEELLQKTWVEITFPKEKVDEDAANVEKLLSGEHTGYIMEKQYRHKDGHMIDITLSVQGVRKKDGTIDYILILVDDITAEKQNEKFLLSQRNFGMAISTVTDLDELYRVAIETLADITGMECGMIYLFDEEQKKLDTVYSKGLSEPFVSATAHYDEHSENVKFVRLGKPVFGNYNELPVELSEIEQAEKLVSIAILPVVNKGKVIGCINLASHQSVSMPVSLQKGIEVIVTLVNNAIIRVKTEEEIRALYAGLEIQVEERTEQLGRAKAEAERANVAKSEFLSRMSHELRTPLNSILGFAQLMSRSETNQEGKNRINQILKSGIHLLDLINEVLNLARIESGRLSLSLEPVQLAGLIIETLDIVHPIAEERKIKLELAESPFNGLFVKCDRQKLKQVMINLINNAIKYNRKEGEVEVTITRMGDNIRIHVRDTGIGIAAEELHKVFEPFQRVGTEISEVEGTGLGLSVAKKLVVAMNGTIGVESEFGVGSTFWIELPQTESLLERNRQAHNINKTENRNNSLSGTILYIEDNISNIQLVEDILGSERPNINLLTEMYGKNAVKMATDYKPGLILLDLDLPDIHGSKVLNLLQTDAATKSIPVVVLSADAMEHSVTQLLAAGAWFYLTKPLDVDKFLEVADEIMIKNGMKND